MLSAISQSTLLLCAAAAVWSNRTPFKIIATIILVINAGAVLAAAALR